MAVLINDVKVKAGTVLRVRNTEKAELSNAKDEYDGIWIEDPDGTNERCILLTDHEMETCRKVKVDGIDLVAGRLAIINARNGKLNLLKIEDKIMLVPQYILEAGEYRASRNPEDLPEKGWWTDLKD